jgi:hypothetical protein
MSVGPSYVAPPPPPVRYDRIFAADADLAADGNASRFIAGSFFRLT